MTTKLTRPQITALRLAIYSRDGRVYGGANITRNAVLYRVNHATLLGLSRRGLLGPVVADRESGHFAGVTDAGRAALVEATAHWRCTECGSKWSRPTESYADTRENREQPVHCGSPMIADEEG